MSLPRIGDRLGSSGGSEGLLPGYTRLEYLQSDGKQYINTKKYLDQDCEVIVECSADDFWQHYIFGARTNASTNDMFCFILGDVANAYPQFDGNRGSVGNQGLLMEIKQRSKIKLNSSGCYINDRVLTQFTSYSNFTTPVPATLFAMNQADGLDARTFNGKIYSFQIFKNEKIILNLVPALDSDNHPCMFDTVSQIPFPNMGSGKFTWG